MFPGQGCLAEIPLAMRELCVVVAAVQFQVCVSPRMKLYYRDRIRTVQVHCYKLERNSFRKRSKHNGR